MTTADTTTAIWYESNESKLLFSQIGQKCNIFLGVLQNFNNWFTCAMDEKRLKSHCSSRILVKSHGGMS